MNPVDFTGRVVVVTGAGNGLGRHHAREFARRGAAVVVNDIATDADGRPAADIVAEQIRRDGGRALANHDSVATVTGPASIAAATLEAFGRIDVLVNNAGYVRETSFTDVSDALLDGLIGVHLRGGFRLAQLACRTMREQGYGRIINTASSAAAFGFAGGTAYAAAKGGLLGLTRALALEAAKDRITVNAVLPLAITGIAAQVSAQHQDSAESALGPIAPRLSPEWVTPLFVLLASEQWQRTGEVYSAVAGRYARVFTAVGHGFVARHDTPPTADELWDHRHDIGTDDGYVVPVSGDDEIATVAAAIGDHDKETAAPPT